MFGNASTNIIITEVNSMAMEPKRWFLLLMKISIALSLKVEEVKIKRSDKRPF